MKGQGVPEVNLVNDWILMSCQWLTSLFMPAHHIFLHFSSHGEKWNSTWCTNVTCKVHDVLMSLDSEGQHDVLMWLEKGSTLCTNVTWKVEYMMYCDLKVRYIVY